MLVNVEDEQQQMLNQEEYNLIYRDQRSEYEKKRQVQWEGGVRRGRRGSRGGREGGRERERERERMEQRHHVASEREM